jgi:glucokinase
MKPAIGIEIGGTKLQAGIGLKDEKLLSLVRTQVEVERGAGGILEAIPVLVDEALAKANCSLENMGGIGVGFGGPVDSKNGITLLSHQIQGWDNFPLKQWLEAKWRLPAVIQNDASLAGYAEAVLGAGRGCRRIFYITIGSGIGGGLITDGIIDEGQGLGAAEIGHTWILNPDTREMDKLEHVCSGWSIGQRAQDAVLSGEPSILNDLCDDNAETITAQTVYQAAEQHDILATAIIEETTTALAVAIGNVINLLHPKRIVIGGGVSMMGPLFWVPLKKKVQHYVMKPFLNRYEIVSASLREEVVIIGATFLGGRQ